VRAPDTETDGNLGPAAGSSLEDDRRFSAKRGGNLAARANLPIPLSSLGDNVPARFSLTTDNTVAYEGAYAPFVCIFVSDGDGHA
jgi:hypothetical protein